MLRPQKASARPLVEEIDDEEENDKEGESDDEEEDELDTVGGERIID